jgi:UDP-glucose:(heptosyl)LPS alpha-1,3-glucosyltransferase
MKIGLANKQLDLRGETERDFYLTAEGLRDLGHEVHLFCGEFRVPPPAGTQAHKVPFIRFGRTAQLLSFANLGPIVIRPYNCDVVLSFGRMISQDILRSGGGSHRVYLEKMRPGEGALRRLWHRVSLYHQSVLGLETLQFQPNAYKQILAVSQEVKREILHTYGVPEDKIVVIYNGVDLHQFHPRNREQVREKIKQKWGIPPEAPLVLFVGSGFLRKGLDRLIRGWGAASLSTVYLLVVGDDLHWNRYLNRAKTQGKGRIVLTGRQSNIADYFAAADILALPALQEAFGNVIMEALASGVPVITTPIVGAAEQLKGRLKDGILSNADDSREMEEKILWMLDRDRWPSLSTEARKIAENFTWKNHFQELETYLMEAAKNGQT